MQTNRPEIGRGAEAEDGDEDEVKIVGGDVEGAVEQVRQQLHAGGEA